MHHRPGVHHPNLLLLDGNMSKEKAKSEKKVKSDTKDGSSNRSDANEVGDLLTKDDLKIFLMSVRDKVSDKSAPAVYALGSLNHVLTLPNVYDILSDENKEIARDLWLRVRQSGFHVTLPPMLFSDEEIAGMS